MSVISKTLSVLSASLILTSALCTAAPTEQPSASIPPQALNHSVEPTLGKEDLVSQINLTPTQKKQVETLRLQTRTKVQPLVQEAMVKRQSLVEYMATPNAQENEALTRQRDIERLQQSIAEEQLKGMFQIREILTQEQLQKLSSLQTQRLHQMAQRRQRLQQSAPTQTP